MAYDYETLSVRLERGVLFTTIDNPPCNIISLQMLAELTDLGETIASDNDVRVAVLQSDDPVFFIAHFHVPAVIDMPAEGPPKKSFELGPFHKMCVQFRDNPKPSLVKIGGRAGGGGCELASSCDMRFGVRGKTILNQMEVPLGILPGGSGTTNLPRLVGRGRALEIILGADDLDADNAEKWGYLNRVFDTTEEMNGFVDNLAFRIALWPPQAVALAKESVGNADDQWRQGLIEENFLCLQSLRYPDVRRLMTRFMEMGGQTRAGEMRVAELCVEVAKAANETNG